MPAKGGRHHLGTRGRLFLGIGGRHHFGIRGRITSEFAITLPSGQNVRVWISTGHTDMRCGFPSLALRVQEVLKLNPLDGNLFVFRGRSGSLIK
ncbi:IS66 family insertion sequence element accessory protein TnpB [Rhizobium sp. BK252]|uniref:IS66 family insertion sequence element accessory protein TnpB n=1 Tax=Rhizobium sp. BK252 TaxID=2587076 RepID=UPI0032B28C8C